jgi:hypothetical protein
MEDNNIFQNMLENVEGHKEDTDYLRKEGYSAGVEFSNNIMDMVILPDDSINTLQKKLHDYKINVLRMESYDIDTGNITISFEHEIDFNKLQLSNNDLCSFNEGFVAGILEVYTGRKYDVQLANNKDNNIQRFNGKRILAA